MTDVTQILQAVEAGENRAPEELLELVYEELKQLANRRLAHEADGHSLQTTDLVHEAYVRLFGTHRPSFENRAHFFGAASEAMRRVLVDGARRRLSEKRGGGAARVEIDLDLLGADQRDEKLLRLQEALDRLEKIDPEKVRLVKLRFFAGLPIREVADVLGISTATANRHWRLTRAWLQREIQAE